jgi:hypothetical protein
VKSPGKICQLAALLMFLCVCAALCLPPAVAGARPAGIPALARKAGTGKHAHIRRCDARSHKRRRGCRSHSRHAPVHERGAAGPSIGPAPTQPAPAEDPAGSPEETEPEAPEDLESPAEEEEEEEEEGEAEAPAGTEEASSLLTNAVTAPAGALRWAPPLLVEPKTITLGTGYTHTTLANNRDYVIKLPTTKKVGGTWIDGGHNVVIVGGAVTVPAPAGTTETGAERRAFYIKGTTGTVHIEGVEIDNPSGTQFDGVAIAAPNATVQLENLRITNLRGGLAAYHSDIVQPWGGVKALRMDHLTGSSDYQGLTLAEDLGPIGSSVISNVNLVALSTPTTDKGGHMLWLTKGTQTCQSQPVHLSNVYLQPRNDRSLSTSVWPPSSSSLGCPASGDALVSWPKLQVVAGGVGAGTPVAGDYVPAGSVGLRYKTPGYLGS